MRFKAHRCYPEGPVLDTHRNICSSKLELVEYVVIYLYVKNTFFTSTPSVFRMLGVSETLFLF